MKSISASEMKRLEQRAFASGKLQSIDAMEAAGRGVAAAVMRAGPWGTGRAARALVLCGPGNNGGDGYVVARLLQERGWDLSVYALAGGSAAGADATANRQRWEAMGPTPDLLRGVADGGPVDVVVDALFGIGLGRGVSGRLADVFAQVAACTKGAYRVAVDVPSGVDADTGQVPGAVLVADMCVTFHQRKPVHLLRPDLCGTVQVVDIGL